MKDSIIAQMAVGMAKGILQIKVAELLEKAKIQLPKDKYMAYLKAGDSFFDAMAELAKLTKTSIDDTAVTVFSEPINAAINEG